MSGEHEALFAAAVAAQVSGDTNELFKARRKICDAGADNDFDAYVSRLTKMLLLAYLPDDQCMIDSGRALADEIKTTADQRREHVDIDMIRTLVCDMVQNMDSQGSRLTSAKLAIIEFIRNVPARHNR